MSSGLEEGMIGDLILQVAVMPVEGYLARYNMGNAKDLSHRVLADYHRVTCQQNTASCLAISLLAQFF